ncbi:MAG: CapA family protein [Eubacteriales bacterium]|nr:CapA family protein [Eubacteriales bacterium]
MQKNNSIRYWMVGCLLAMGTVLLTGCQKEEPQRIAVSQQAAEAVTEADQRQDQEQDRSQNQKEQAEPDSVDIVIEQEGAEAADIVIEQPTQEDAAEQSESPADSEEQNPPIRLLFGGDVLLSDHVLNAYQKAGGVQGILDDGYRQLISDADFFMVNQEFPFSDGGVQAPDKQYTFRLPPEKVSIFTEMGIDGVTLANNHALDYGTDALLDSCQILDGAGILRTGAGAGLEEAKRPVTIQLAGRDIAIIGATRVIPVADWAAGANHPGMLATYDPVVLLEEIRLLSEKQDYVIAFVHWGIERDELPQEYQRALAKQYIDAGADLVVGSHPHVLQGIEYYKGKPIVYSLGNFVFGSSIPRTMLLEVTLPGGSGSAGAEGEVAGAEAAGTEPAEKQNQEMTLRLIPGTSSGGYTKMLTDQAGLAEFYEYMESISFGVVLGEDGLIVQQP